jgi:hypothetical protein
LLLRICEKCIPKIGVQVSWTFDEYAKDVPMSSTWPKRPEDGGEKNSHAQKEFIGEKLFLTKVVNTGILIIFELFVLPRPG